MMNVSKRTVSSASFVQDHGCRALNDCIESGKISASLAETFCKVITDPKEQAKIAKRGPRSIMRELRERNAMPQDPPHQQAKNLRSIIQQHLDKAVRAIDDLNRVNQNRPAQMAAIKLIQAVKLW